MKKQSLRGISTPLGGLSWAPVDDKEERAIKLANAKAFEAGRVLMGTYLAIQFDKEYNYKDVVERVAVYLSDIGVKNLNLKSFNYSMSYGDLEKIFNSINNQLWGKGGELGKYFEISLHLFTALAPGKSALFKELAGNLDIPSNILKNNKDPAEMFILIRQHFEGIILPDSIVK